MCSETTWRAKTAVPFPAAVAGGSQPLRDIYLLTVADVPDVTVTRQSGAALFDALQDCIYGPLLPTDAPRVFGLQAQVCQSVRVWRIQRPRSAVRAAASSSRSGERPPAVTE